MITVTLSEDKKRLNLKAHYIYKDQIKQIRSASFNWDKRMWSISVRDLDILQMMFEGEIYYKTPLWQIEGKPEPDKQEIKWYGHEDVEIPQLRLTPYDYQKTGIRFMIDRLYEKGFVLNSDAVGLGKSLQSIGALKHFMQHEGVKKVLIVCKKSIKNQWQREYRKVTGDMRTPILVTGSTKKKRLKTYNELGDKGILITNYHNFLKDSEDIQKLGFDFAIIDEVHSIKGHETKMNNYIANTVNGLKTILLTGTPIMSKPHDIFGIIQIANKGVFGSYGDFERNYIVTDVGIYGKQIVGARNLDVLGGIIKDFTIRRTAEDISIELPEVSIETVFVPMDDVQKTMEIEIVRRLEKLQEAKEQYLIDGEVIPGCLAQLQELAEKEKMYISAKQFIADDPRCFKSSTTKIGKVLDDIIPKDYAMSSKTETTLDYIEDIVQSGCKVLVFTHFRRSALLLAEDVKTKLKENVLMYTGAEDDETRIKNVQLFWDSDEHNILIATEAAAEGLNLQCANYVINYEQADTYAQKNQRIGRVRRVGSKYSHAHVYDMVTEYSYDENKMEKIERDKNLSESLITVSHSYN